MDPQKIKLNGFEFTFQDDGSWIYKALPFKKERLPEKPHLKVVEEVETKYKNFFDVMLRETAKEIKQYLNV